MILWVAPMDWITDMAFRIITKQVFDKYNINPDNKLNLRTEFMNAEWYRINPSKVVKHLIKTDFEIPTIAQVYGANNLKIVETLVDIQEKYKNRFIWVELNLGCPANKVVNCWGGSGMLYNRNNLTELIDEISKKITIPFSIKTRAWLNIEDKKTQKEFLIQMSKYCHIISIHWRTTQQWYAGDADRDFIYDIKENLEKQWSKCKIIGNWWIKEYQDIEKMKWNLDGIMIGQACIWNPRIFTNHIPSNQEKLETILHHLELMAKSEIYFKDFYDKNKQKKDITLPILTLEKLENIDIIKNYEKIYYSPIEFRKYLFNYIKWIPWSKEFKMKLIEIKDYFELIKTIQHFFTVNTNFHLK